MASAPARRRAVAHLRLGEDGRRVAHARVGSQRGVREEPARAEGPSELGLYPIVTLQYSSTTLYQDYYHI
jgi:hypothetical protein